MADKVEKPKKSKAKPKKDEKGVLAALPSTRPERIGTRRTAGAKTSPATSSTAKTARTASAKASPAKRSTAKKPAATKTSSTTAKRAAATAEAKRSTRPTAARRRAAAPRTFEPTLAAESAAGAADERAAGVATEPRPRAVREGAPGMGTTRPDRSEAEAAESGRPSGVELVTTAVQAAGELTQIGLTIGGRIIKRAVDRLPRP